MSYLTHEEYKEFGYSDIDDSEFSKLITKASDFLDIQTRNYYINHSLKDDIEFRKLKFKKAIALQIEYMYQSGASSSYDINTPQSWTIGRTSVSESSRYSSNGKNETPSIVSEDAISMLSGTGLLYRGLR
ncbi:hypothetical protein BG261_05375 [Floricoccus tropicus]|uniref:Phage gp6-like head-tail connector protein n=1 Tax=Floricoccus tropicus TaxID=1859473 RepID=A0A1E8GKP4_9LACT|nr:hypothetical protein [Floricoccus tropicus]OFI48821.1 hypothetical protein BG261_05375 [Floricoccus tropicus]